MTDFNIFIDCNNDLDKIQNVLQQAKNNGFVMASDFDKNIPSAEKLYNDFRKYNHGNAKIILHFFYNNITGRKEIAYGTKSAFLSYPQFKSIKITKF